MKNSDLEIKLEDFKGPLDLLLHLIEKNKIDIYDIPIVEITDQYMSFIDKAENSLSIASEFLVTAATLISIKTKMLLPIYNDNEDDPREELVEILLEYKYYKKVAEKLHDLEINGGKTVIKSTTLPDEVLEFEYKPKVDEIFNKTSLDELSGIFRDILKRFDERIDKQRVAFDKVLEDRWTIADRIEFFRIFTKEKTSFTFSELMIAAVNKIQVVVTFLALLELTKLGELAISQEKDDIKIEVVCG